VPILKGPTVVYGVCRSPVCSSITYAYVRRLEDSVECYCTVGDSGANLA
jgi:hypothetical protein